MTLQEFKPMSRDRLEAYAAREQADREIGTFEGGAPPNAVWIGLAVVCVLVLVIYWLFVDPGKIRPGS